MKRLSCWLSSLCLATMCACVGDAGIYTLSSHPLDENCMCDSTVIRPSGTLDVSAQELFQDSSYHLGILLQNDLDGEDTDTVGAQRNLFYLRQIVLYKLCRFSCTCLKVHLQYFHYISLFANILSLNAVFIMSS